MLKTKIAGAAAALALLVAPSVAAAHEGHHRGHHHQHHAKKVKVRSVAAGAPTATVASFTNGQLTLTLASGKTFAATVTDKTIVKCWTAAPQTTATASRHGDDDAKGDDDDAKGDDDGAKGDDHGDDDDRGRGDANGNGRCGTDALVAGAKVAFAKLTLTGVDATWKKVVVLK